MPDTELKLIPADPEFVPNPDVMASVKKLLISYRRWAEEVSAVSTDEVRFIDQGGNFEKIICPKCSDEMDIAWWQETMDTAYQTNFKNLNVILPCCGTSSSLNDLEYHWPAGFAKFVITFRNPARDLSKNKIPLLEEIIGCRLKTVLARY